MENKENKSDLRFEQEDDAVWVFSGDSQQGTEISHLITSHIDDYNEDDLRLICHYAANEIDRLRAKLDKAAPEGFVLDAPARVGGGVFREGVKWKTVIESAQRLYEHSKDEIKPIVSPADLLKIASGDLVLVPKEKIGYLVNELNTAFQSIPILTLGDLLPLQQDFQAMIEAQEQSHD